MLLSLIITMVEFSVFGMMIITIHPGIIPAVKMKIACLQRFI
jgi:hypothetical protein